MSGVMPELDRPQHPWNDPDNDGHNCVDCPEDSIWKCDQSAHDEAEKLRADIQQGIKDAIAGIGSQLREMANARHRAASRAREIPLP